MSREPAQSGAWRAFLMRVDSDCPIAIGSARRFRLRSPIHRRSRPHDALVAKRPAWNRLRQTRLEFLGARSTERPGRADSAAARHLPDYQHRGKSTRRIRRAEPWKPKPTWGITATCRLMHGLRAR